MYIFIEYINLIINLLTVRIHMFYSTMLYVHMHIEIGLIINLILNRYPRNPDLLDHPQEFHLNLHLHR